MVDVVRKASTLASLVVIGCFALTALVSAGSVLLNTPEVRPDMTRVVVTDTSDHPDQQALSYMVSIQYQEGGVWKQGKNFARVVRNMAAVVDDPLTTEIDETQAALTTYTKLMNKVVAGVDLDQIILDRVKAKPGFAGTISTIDGQLVLTLTTPRVRPDVTRMKVRTHIRSAEGKAYLIGEMQYREGGKWKVHRKVKKELADKTDDPATPGNEASTAYTDFKSTMDGGGKSMEGRGMDEMVKDHPGTIQ